MSEEIKGRVVASLDDQVSKVIAEDRQIIEAAKAILKARAESTGVHLIRESDSSSKGS
jgi:hypothetical protein